MPEHAAWRRHAELTVDDAQRVDDRRVVRREHAEADEVEEARVDDAALVDVRVAAVADAVGGARVRVAVLGEAQEVRPARVRAVGRRGPALDLRLPVVGGRQVAVGRRRVVVGGRDLRRAHQAGDLAGDRGGGVARLVLPAILRRPRRGVAVLLEADQEVRGALDVRPRRGVAAPELVGQHDRERDLVELQPAPEGRAGRRRVLRERAVGLLLLVEQEVQGATGAGGVAVGDQGGGDLVEVARPDQVVRAARRLAAPDPRHRGRGDVGAAVAPCPRSRPGSWPTRGRPNAGRSCPATTARP